MIRRDYHGCISSEALLDVERIITQVRMRCGVEDLELIVGRGVIRTSAMALLKTYGLEPTLQLGNDGVILCTVE